VGRLAGLVSILSATTAFSAGGTTLEGAIRAAWAHNAQFLADGAEVDAANSDAEAAQAAVFPALQIGARALRTDQPAAAFGLKLDQGRITEADFDPARLNSPEAVAGWGVGATLTQPLYAGGRIEAGARAAHARANAAGKSHGARRQLLAVSVVAAYFGAQVAAKSVDYADDTLAHARETERFVRERVAQKLLLESEALRASAFRAQAEAERASRVQALKDVRSALDLLVGTPVAALETPLESQVPNPAVVAVERPEVAAARFQLEAAHAADDSATGALLPELFLQLGVETFRHSWSQGNVWTSIILGARWQLSLGELRTWKAAKYRASGAAAALQWQEDVVRHEASTSRAAVDSADANVRSAREAVAASESVRTLRDARHREGLLPLTEVLDAESGLSSARNLLLRSELEARLSRARLDLALGQPVEGIKP